MMPRQETTNLSSKLQESVFNTILGIPLFLLTDLEQNQEINQGMSQEIRVLAKKLNVKYHVLSQPIFTTARAR